LSSKVERRGEKRRWKKRWAEVSRRNSEVEGTRGRLNDIEDCLFYLIFLDLLYGPSDDLKKSDDVKEREDKKGWDRELRPEQKTRNAEKTLFAMR